MYIWVCVYTEREFSGQFLIYKIGFPVRQRGLYIVHWLFLHQSFAMENHFAGQTMTLSMNISCCEGCPKILKKKLLKMPGVDSVAIDTENNLVFVTGSINPTTLLNKVAKLGKSVQLLPTDKGRDNNFSRSTREKGKMHKNCCCQDGLHSQKKEVKVKEEGEHNCEAYVAPKVDERVCRDYYCKIHPTIRKIVDKVPAESSSLFGIGGLPFYGGFGPYGGGSYMYPGWYGEEPPQFGYGRQPRMLPQHPFAFQ